MEETWTTELMEMALAIWNEKLAEVWTLLSMSPQEFKGGAVWNVAVSIHNGLLAVSYGLLILFFAMSIFKSAMDFHELKRPEVALRFFIRFAAAKVAVTYGMEIMGVLFTICAGIMQTVAGGLGDSIALSAELPDAIKEAVIDAGFVETIPLFLIAAIGVLFITVISFVIVLTVYGRFFKLYIYTALAPIPLATFAGETTSQTGKAFVKSYLGVCLQGAVIILACIIYNAFASSGTPELIQGTTAVSMVWSYFAEVGFNMLILVILIKGADSVIREMMAL